MKFQAKASCLCFKLAVLKYKQRRYITTRINHGDSIVHAFLIENTYRLGKGEGNVFLNGSGDGGKGRRKSHLLLE